MKLLLFLFLFLQGASLLFASAVDKPIFVLMGPAASGKGTQAEFLSRDYGVPAISVGDLFRDHIRSKSELGQMIITHNAVKDSYVPDVLPLGMVAERISQDDCLDGFILDGFPRSVGQAQMAVRLLKNLGKMVPVVLHADSQLILKRIQNRFICPKCGLQVRQHHIGNKTCCPDCGIDVEVRKKDSCPKTIEKQIDLYESSQEAIEEFFFLNGISLHHVLQDEKSTPHSVYQSIQRLFHETGLPIISIEPILDDPMPAVNVATIVIKKNGKTLFLKRNDDKKDGGKWGIPGGKIEEQETPTDAILRELQEETGISMTSEQVRFVKRLYIFRKNCCYYTIDLFLGDGETLSEFDKNITLSSREHSEWRWVTPSEVQHMSLIPSQCNVLRHI